MAALPAIPFLSSAAASVLFASVWQGVLLTSCVALCLRLVKGVTPAVRSGVWSAVLALVVLLPVVSIAVPHVQVHGFRGVAAPIAWTVPLVAVWLALSLYRAALLTLSAVRLATLVRRAEEIEPQPEILALLRAGSRHARLCTSPEIERPCVAGFFRPRILLPCELPAQLSRDEMAQVVLHEMEHLRRRDDWTNLLQQIALVLLPLNPVLLWLNQRLCLERELACDDGVVRATRARKAYAACLVRLAEDSMVRRGVSLALAAVGAQGKDSELARRVRRILFDRSVLLPGKRLRGVTAALLAGVVGMASLLASSPELVRFSAPPPAVEQALGLPSAAPLPAGPDIGRGVTLVKAVMKPAGVPMVRPATFRLPSRRPKRRSAHRERAFVPVLVQEPVWRPALAGPNRLTLTSFELSQPVYAAVPWQGGWLVVQL